MVTIEDAVVHHRMHITGTSDGRTRAACLHFQLRCISLEMVTWRRGLLDGIFSAVA